MQFVDRHLFLGAAALAVAAALLLLFAPVYESGRTLIQANGAEVAWVIFVPLALALLPLAAPPGRRRVAGYAAGAVLLAICFVSSAGIFFLVPAIVLLLAAHAAPQANDR
jgi:hypothetical protein